MVDRSDRSSRPEVFLRKSVLKICSKFTGEHPCRSAISIKLLCNSIEMARRYGCSLVNLMHILGRPFLKNTSGRLLTKWAATIMAKISALSILEENCFHYDENNVCFYIRGASLTLYTKLPSFRSFRCTSIMTKTAFVLVLKVGLLLWKPKLGLFQFCNSAHLWVFFNIRIGLRLFWY